MPELCLSWLVGCCVHGVDTPVLLILSSWEDEAIREI